MNKSAAALVLTGAAVAVSTAYAAGFQLTEQSSLGLGRAYAGAGIVGDDLSAVHYNPAGMTLLEGTRFQAGTTWIALNADYNGKDGDSENGRLKGQMIPAGYVTHQVNDKIWLGFAMTVPFGMGTEYDRNWSQSQRGTNAKIYTFDMNPNIAWKVNDFLSVGAGISVQYAKAELGMGIEKDLMGMKNVSLGHGKVEADSWDWGFNLGVMISPTDKLRFGLAYRSAIEHDAEGTTKINGIPLAALGDLDGQTFGMSTTIKTPDTVMLTGTWEATDQLRLSGLIRWANWSNFEELNIENDVPASILSKVSAMGLDSSMLTKLDVVNDWKDTWLFSVGADYKINSAFVFGRAKGSSFNKLVNYWFFSCHCNRSVPVFVSS